MHDIHFQLKILVIVFIIILAGIIYVCNSPNTSDIESTALIGMGNTCLGYIGALIVNRDKNERKEDKTNG